MQRCSELGNDPKAWQELFRFGKSKLVVTKGPNGHYLDRECQEELKKCLPAESFKSLMSLVATWMTRLDEKDKAVRRKRESKRKVRKELQSEPPLEQLPPTEATTVVDLCSDGEEKSSLGEDEDSLDTATVLSRSSIVVIDDDLGEVNLKDFADHVEGNLDVKTLRERNHKEQNTKASSIVKILGPLKTDTLQRSLKTYAKKRNPPAITTSEDTKVLKEANKEVTTGGLHPEKQGGSTLVAAAQQKLQIVTEPTAYYNLLAKPSDLEQKPIPENNSNAGKKSETETEPKKCLTLEQAVEDQTKGATSPEESLRIQTPEPDNHVPQIRIRTDLGPDQRDVIRVRTDLLHEQPPDKSPLNPSGNQSLAAETLVPQTTAEKRRLSEGQSVQQPAKKPALETYNPPAQVAPSTSSTASGNPASTMSYQIIPAQAKPPYAAPRIVTVKCRLIRPKAIATATTTGNTYELDVSYSLPNRLTTSTQQSASLNSASVSSSGTPSGTQMCPATSTSSHLPNISANIAAAPSNCTPVNPRTTALPAPSPIIPIINHHPPGYQYRPANPRAAAPVGTSIYPPPPRGQVAPVPPSSYSQAAPLPSAPAAVTTGGAQPSVPLDPRNDLSKVMGMLSEVELFAFRQENQEAFHLVNQLRNSLQRGAAAAYPQ